MIMTLCALMSLEDLQPDTIIGHLQDRKPKIYQAQCDWFSTRNGDSETETPRTKVATLSKRLADNLGSENALERKRNLSTSFLASSLLSKEPSYTIEVPPSLLDTFTTMSAYPWPKKRSQRKFVDLIKEADYRWPNWDPSNIILAGEFGTIDKKTGEWMTEGNIYTHPEIKPLADQYPLVEKAEPDEYIHSYEVREKPVPAEVAANPAPGLVFTHQWQFNARRGAVVVMHSPRPSIVPKGFFKEALKRRFPALEGKSVIYKVYKSPGFFMYLSNKTSEQVTISLHANLNRPTPGVNRPPQAPFIWSSQGTSGTCHSVYRASGSYTPLFALKSARRHLSMRAQTHIWWEETDVPWDDLNDDGMTEPEEVYE
ncbi:hypothetical protein BGW80DRAFT_842263 [Lactifluus volemus]|nr:hypothetical protein BGW80DRAFT_842263 [Lactifluus volemus]